MVYLNCYKKLPLNEKNYAVRHETVFRFKLAVHIGDNRFSSEVDRELLEDAVNWGTSTVMHYLTKKYS